MDKENPIIIFLKRLLIFSLILGFITFGVGYFFPKFVTPALPALIIFFIGVTLGGYYVLTKAAKRQFIKFLNYYLLITGLKLLLFIGVLITYIMFNTKDAAPFGITFFILYLLYSIFEVVSLVSYSKTLKQ